MNTSVNLGGIIMKNPVTTASGTFGFGLEYQTYVDLSRLGAITVKGTTLKPRLGNPPPRIAETPSGMLNAIGLQNPGVERVAEEIMPRLAALGVPVIINIAGDTLEDYAQVACRLNGVTGVAGLEVNISCPNVKKGGIQFGSDPHTAAEVTRAVKSATGLPIIVKLSPNVTDLVAMAEAVAGAGADALSMINTLVGIAIDVDRRRPVLANITGGLSGPAVRPVAVRAVWQVHRALPLMPILGMEEFNLSELVAEIVRETVMIDPHHEFKSKSDSGVYTIGDIQLIKQALRIFIDNSVKYTPHDGAISVTTSRDGDYAKVVVQDTGIGIPPLDIPYVFDRFFRADDSRARKTGGTGLGLSIAKWIIDRHQGTVEILSREDIGTRIIISLPVIKLFVKNTNLPLS
jgi:dihydroorotate dehydrogenase (NAD+) catalytic subunit